MISVDDNWFSELRCVEIPRGLNPVHFYNRDKIRARWDTVEQNMRVYLANLQDSQLLEKPIAEGEDKDLVLWQILSHVVNHGTDHRSQVLRIIHDFEIKTPPQDLAFYAYNHP